tara:strand:+ start:99 stop:2363 length:2265 start_codon:yes stop_codon:yes gene_type:complete
MKKVIYVYKQRNSEDNTYKIGKADQRLDQDDATTIERIATIRIQEQMTAANYGQIDIVATYDISQVDSSIYVESSIHADIQAQGFPRQKREVNGKIGNTEWFNFRDLDQESVLSIVGDLVEEHTGTRGLADYIPRVYQSQVKDQVVDVISNGGKIIGAELAARFGKTLWTLDTFKTLCEDFDFQYLVLPTYVLTAHTSFQKELRSFSDFEDMVFISDKDDNFTHRITQNIDKKLVIAISLHTSDESQDKYDVVWGLPDSKKISFIDEADFGAHTGSSKKRIDNLGCSTKVLMTGTSIDRALVGYDVDSVIKWSYFDMLLLKDGNHPMLDSMTDVQREEAISSCAPIVRPTLYKMSMPNTAAVQAALPDSLQTKWSKLLSDVDSSRFILETIVKAMFTDDVGDLHDLISLKISDVTESRVNMIFGAFKNKKQQSKFTKMVESCLGDEFVVLKINGDETSNRKAEATTKALVAQAKREGKRVILISRDMASRSFSIPEIDTVFLMYDNGLLSQTIQKASRAFTPGKTYGGEVKADGTIISLSLDSRREEIDPIDLYILAEAQRITEDDEVLQDSILRILNSVNIFKNDINGKIEVDKDEYSKDMLKRSSILKQALASLALDRINYEEFEHYIMSHRAIATSLSEDYDVDISVAKTSEKESKKKDESQIDKKHKALIETILFLIQNITALKEFDGYKNNNIREILGGIESQELTKEVESFYGLYFTAIPKLLDDKIVPEKLLNTVLEGHEPQVINFK